MAKYKIGESKLINAELIEKALTTPHEHELSAKTAADYLARYVRRYREEYRRFTSPPPAGGGFPKLTVSPYLSSPELHCHIAEDGAVLADFSWSPE